jgi:hypothetical protein
LATRRAITVWTVVYARGRARATLSASRIGPTAVGEEAAHTSRTTSASRGPELSQPILRRGGGPGVLAISDTGVGGRGGLPMVPEPDEEVADGLRLLPTCRGSRWTRSMFGKEAE